MYQIFLNDYYKITMFSKHNIKRVKTLWNRKKYPMNKQIGFLDYVFVFGPKILFSRYCINKEYIISGTLFVWRYCTLLAPNVWNWLNVHYLLLGSIIDLRWSWFENSNNELKAVYSLCSLTAVSHCIQRYIQKDTYDTSTEMAISICIHLSKIKK